ncbi:MAG: 5-formyltetrahydrofolate cyclo-ligase [Actinomycetota bacterium]
MNSAGLKRAKRRIRREVIAERDALSTAARERGSERIAERFLALPEVEGATAVMVFSSFGSEVATTQMMQRLRDAGVSVALPRIEDGELVALPYVPGDPVRPTPFGALEPIGTAPVAAASLDVVGVPGVAFDRYGRRIGYGGGYYDRFLRDLPVFRVGIAFGLQVRNEDLPTGSFDLPVHAIVTEDETIRPPT